MGTLSRLAALLLPCLVLLAAAPDAACLAAAGDTNCDAAVDSLDALAILRFVAGLPSQRPPGCAPLGFG